MRTLVVSDLHIGARLGHDVVLHPAPRERLLIALDGVDRLVLLGDVVELLEGRAQSALRAAEPVLRAIGERLGPDREVMLVPGNHDEAFVRPLLRDRSLELGLDTVIAPDATEPLEIVSSFLAPARMEVRYPGTWLSERVWATHGHYLDRHLLPESAFGIARGLLGRLPRSGATPLDYEFAGGPSLTRLEALLTRWLPRPLAALVEDGFDYLRAATMPPVTAPRIPHFFAPLISALLGLQLRRAGIPALARVVLRLGVPAEWVVFGHVHRLGPLPGDDPGHWTGPDGRPKIANTGSWHYEPRLLHNASPPHPYWPGGAILIEDEADPTPIGLLDDLDPLLLRGL